MVAELLAELLPANHETRVIGIQSPAARREAEWADFLVICYPTYFLRPSLSIRELIATLKPSPTPSFPSPSPSPPSSPAFGSNRRAFLVTTYELYTENSLRVCALLLQ